MNWKIILAGFQVLRVERTDGTEIPDWDSKPPDTVYVVGKVGDAT